MTGIARFEGWLRVRRGLRHREFRHRGAACVLMLVALGAAGCDLPERPIIAERDIERPAESNQVEEEFETSGLAWSEDWDAWFLYTKDQKPVGYSHVSARYGPERQDDWMLKVPAAALLELTRTDRRAASVWYDVQDVIEFKRGNASFLQSLQQVTRETTSGQLRSFWTRLRVGPSETHATGVVEDEQLAVETFRGQKRSARTMVWQTETRGSLAVMQSLKNNPMEAGDRRKIKHLLPIKNQIATVTLTAVDETSVPWFDGTSRKLLEVVEEIVVDGRQANASVLCVDSRGEIQRVYTPALSLLSYRVDPSELRSQLASEGSEQLLTAPSNSPPAWVNVVGKEINAPEKLQRVGMLIKPLSEDSDLSISRQPFPDQYVQELGEGRMRLLVSRAEEKVSPGFKKYETESSAADLRVTGLLNFTTKSVRDMSRLSLQGDSLSDLDIALALTETTSQLLEPNAFAGDFNRASDVLLATKGGAFDHSVLLAAMLRERKVPSRIALGLVYQPGERPRFACSAWTLALVDDRWIALDPLSGELAAADRITLKMLDTTTPVDQKVFLPLFQWMEQVEIRVQGFAYRKPSQPPEDADERFPAVGRSFPVGSSAVVTKPTNESLRVR